MSYTSFSSSGGIKSNSETIPTTRIDLTQLERQQAELEQREKRLAERERELRNSHQGLPREKNFPPLPQWFPCRPCLYQDINVEIPGEFQIWVRYLYYLWLSKTNPLSHLFFHRFLIVSSAYVGTLALNIVAALANLLVDSSGIATFGLAIFYFILFTPASYLCWFRPIYRAFR